MIELNIELPRKNFKVQVNTTFHAGITGIFGPSGSGKTSLLHSIAGLAKPESGYIKMNQRTILDVEKRIDVPVEKRNIGYVFQEGRLFPHMSVEKNLRYGLKKARPSKISFNEVVELLQLKHLLNSKPSQISGGERQRTALGRTLLSSPEILLLDEPFSALDTHLRSQILQFILRIHHIVKIPILVVSHDIPDLLRLTNQLFIIKDGQCLGHDNYHTLLHNKSTLPVFGKSTLINSIPMRVLHSTKNDALTLLGWKKEGPEVLITCEKSKAEYNEGQDIQIFIQAEDIALSTEKLSTISMQNQVLGTIEDMIERDFSLLCIVNVGFRLVVEITHESRKRLGIGKGSQVWCMFKSVAIDAAG